MRIASSAELRPPRPPAEVPPVKGPIKAIFTVLEVSEQAAIVNNERSPTKAAKDLFMIDISSVVSE